MRQLPCIYILRSHYTIMSEITSSTSILKPGIPAPNFTLHSAPDQSIALSQFRGHPTILAFYPVSPIGINPGAEGILKALESIAVSEPKNVENMTEENVSGK
jgi:AhpC/TSA family